MSTPTVEPASYLASLGPLSNVPVTAGTVSLDGTRVPYAVASVTVQLSDIPDLDDVDPRNEIRAELIATDGTNTRDFDLSVQSMVVDENDGTVTFGLTSDESLLQQYTAMADDYTQAQYIVRGIRPVNNYVLDKVIPGTTAGFVDDLNIDVRSNAENLIRNPRVGVNITDWVAVGGLLTTRYTTGGPDPTYPTYMGFQAPPGGGAVPSAQVLYDQQAVSVTPGKRYVLSVDVYADGARQMRLQGIGFDGTNNARAYTTFATATPNYTWVRLSIVFDAGPGIVRLRPTVTPVGGLSAGEYIRVTAWRLSEWTGGIDDENYFDGGFSPDFAWTYSWIGDPHASVSRRQVTLPSYREPQQMAWYTGDTAWDYLAPLNTYYNRRLWCDEDRVWRIMNPDTWSVAGTVEIDGMNATNASNTIALGNPEEYATGVIVRYRWTSLDGMQNEKLDVAGTPDQVRQIQLDTQYPGPGAAQNILDRMTGRGAVLDVTAFMNLAATPGMTAEVTLPGQAMRTLYVSSVEWNLDDGLMSVGTRAEI